MPYFNKWNIKFNHTINWIWKYLNVKQQIKTRRKIYNALWAVFFGLIIAGIFISFTGSSPFTVYHAFFQTNFSNPNPYLRTIIIYIFSGIAVGIGFKAGLFNIGISGQMMFGGVMGVLYFHSFNSSNPDLVQVNSSMVLVSLLIAAISGFAIAMIAGIFKAYLKVNEVVTTILLNWIVYYLVRFIFRTNSPFTASGRVYISKSHVLPNFFASTDFLYVVLFIAIGFAFLIWILMKKTTLGYCIKMTGLSNTAAKYAGVNEKKLTMLIMGFSGLLAGISGFMYYVFNSNIINVDTPGPLGLGFDSIAITMLAYNSPIGIIFSSLFYGQFSAGSAGLTQFAFNNKLNTDTYTIIVGLIIYFAAAAIVFEKLNPLIFIKKIILLNQTKNFYYKKNNQMNQILKKHKKNLKQNLIKIKTKNKLKKLHFQFLVYQKYNTTLLKIWEQKKDLIFKQYHMIIKNYFYLFFLEFKINRLKIKKIKPQIKALKKQVNINWEKYNRIKDPISKMNFFNDIMIQKRKIYFQLEDLGYFKKQNLINNFFANLRNVSYQYNSIKNGAMVIVSSYFYLLIQTKITTKKLLIKKTEADLLKKYQHFLLQNPQQFLSDLKLKKLAISFKHLLANNKNLKVK